MPIKAYAYTCIFSQIYWNKAKLTSEALNIYSHLVKVTIKGRTWTIADKTVYKKGSITSFDLPLFSLDGT